MTADGGEKNQRSTPVTLTAISESYCTAPAMGGSDRSDGNTEGWLAGVCFYTRHGDSSRAGALNVTSSPPSHKSKGREMRLWRY